MFLNLFRKISNVGTGSALYKGNLNMKRKGKKMTNNQIIERDKEERRDNEMAPAVNYFCRGNRVYAEIAGKNPVLVGQYGKHIAD